ncbi:preprotein translocase subunit SecY [Selenomonas sp. TAMA-11512]|uniref:preprotein translocase subunit SecY n=1 Tax=Selenomonas sp. TAMA-11512 TaxID=3095337 RepID=UPI003089E134|nr:preprotein translocase subunit SecY [Selenomonas sp. TAMA-11512]
MFSALQNVYKIPELRQKIVFTLVMFAVFRLGTHIPVPGVDPSAIERLFATGNLFGLLDLFSGGAFSKFSIFAMSITPYINASIIMQLLTVVIPTLEQWSKEGQEGHKKTTKVTRYLTVALAFFQAIGMSFGLREAILNPSPVNIFIIAITLTAGTVFLMWLGEQITANGIGNGISLIIFAGIVAALPKNLGTMYNYLQTGTISYFNAFLFVVIALAMIVFVIYIQEGYRRIPISHAKRVAGQRSYAGHSSHIPLKVNHAGVIPIIFASSVLMFPVTIAQFVQVPWVNTLAGYFAWGTPLQTSIYALLILFFTYFYTAVTVKISDMAENLKKSGGFIPGIRPGAPTEEYLDRVMTRITLAGAFFLAFIAVLPNLVTGATHIEGIYFGGTALLIVVGVALQTMKQIESMVVMRHYEGFMDRRDGKG